MTTWGERLYEQRREDVADDTGEILPGWCSLSWAQKSLWIERGLRIERRQREARRRNDRDRS